MPRDYAREYSQFHGKPEEIERRAKRNAARAKMKAAGKPIAGKDVHHRAGVGAGNAMSNLSLGSKSANRADHR